MALLKYTYEQVLASQAEQVASKANNINKLSEFGKILAKDFDNNVDNNKNLKAI